jgi:hypothetical protein
MRLELHNTKTGIAFVQAFQCQLGLMAQRGSAEALNDCPLLFEEG